MEPSPAQPEAPVIEMDDVAVGSLHDPETVVADQVRWTVHAGDFWVVAGLQGAGKSDFLFMTGGLMGPLHGTYRLLGEPMPIFDEARLRHRLRLGLVFDGGQLFNHLTVAENVALPLRYHRNFSEAEAAAEVTALLEWAELTPWAASTPGALGRNWQKRVGLARALILRPQVLLLDSPLTGLDLRHQAWWLRRLTQLSNGHSTLRFPPITLVATTADLHPWKGHARQFAILRNRRLAVLGTWSQVETANAELLQELLLTEPRPG